MDILGKLFGSPARIKIMRLFLLNPADAFENKDIAQKSKVNAGATRKELSMLESIGFIQKRSFFKELPIKIKKKTKRKSKALAKPKKKRVYGWQLDSSFPMLLSIQNLLVNTEPLQSKAIVHKLKKSGNLKLIVISGVFIQNPDSTLDILIVGDRLKKSGIENAIRAIEAEVGKELAYASLETSEFVYRLGIYDKFIRDILDYPHEKILDRLGL